ncbi:hypothetical protein WAX88_20635 (plasmid) [Photobacterium damselae subsp. damselae]|uniref:hypothetical protein n=1 Tax=Photobacterium damselae TaxID=38293 RepID=UPI00311AFE84
MNIRKTHPEPILIVKYGVYAWKCECEHLLVYGNSKKEAIRAWEEAKIFELVVNN